MGCLEADRQEYRARAERGDCVVCGVRATAGVFCFDHWLSNIGKPYKLNKKNGGLSLLRHIWVQQKGLCAVTGRPLTPGNDASLDHIVASSNGGTNAPSNLRWVLYEVNRAKSNMSHEQFVAMCRDVVRVAGDASAESAGSRGHDMRSN